MRILLIFLGVVTVVLAVVLATENLWWIAVPDAAFGVAVGIAAWESLAHDRRTRAANASAPPEPAPAPAPQPSPAAVPTQPRRRGRR
jgi:hypothetical protein